jgi:hypothetical protein
MASYNLSYFTNYSIFTDQTGSAIYDSGGPTGSYSTGENYYFILAPKNSTGSLIVAVESASFNTTDKIRIYDGVPTKGTTGSFNYTGTTTGSQLIAVLTGTFGTPRYFTASSGRAYVRFSGDTNGTAGPADGFKLSWTGSGFTTPNTSSGVIYNQYGVTFPADGTSGSYMTFARGKLSSSSTLSADKDIIVGFWAKQDTLPASAPEGPVLGIGTYNGGTGFTVSRASSPTPGDNSFRIFYYDFSGSVSSATLRATDIVNGGQLNLYSYPPQWNHYGFVIRKTGINTGEFLAYKDGTLFSSASISKATNWSYISTTYDTVLGSYRDSASGLVLTGGASKATWSGSLDDVFLAAAVSGSSKTEYSTLFNRIYNSGNWANPNVEITGALSASLNPIVIFNWRFEETGSLLNTVDYGYYGNFHSASLTGNIANSSIRLTSTSSGTSFTPYASLSYSASALSNATIAFITSSDSVYENTASYYIGVRATTASVGQSATASISTSSFGATAVLGTDYKLIYGGTTYSASAQLPINISWAAADTSTKYITASIIDNTTYTGTSSSFSLLINTASSTNVVTGSPGFFILRILDYEEGNPSFTSSSYSTGEASGSITIYVDRLSGSQGPLSVNYNTADGTAAASINYTRTSGTLSWTDAETTRKSFSVPIKFDGVQTSSKYFTVNLSSLSTGSFLPYAITSSTVTIADQEQGTFSVESSSYSTIEGNSVTVKVNRYSGSFAGVNVYMTSSDGTAFSGTDYNSIGQYLVFGDGETSKTLTVTTVNNTTDVPPPPLYFTVGISSLTPQYGTPSNVFVGSNPYTTIYITDNESGSIRFSNGSYTGSLGSTITIPVERYAGGDFAATASITMSGGTAVAGVDYVDIFPYTVSWADQESGTKNISLTTLTTNIWSGDKILNLGITNLTNLNIGSTMTSSVLFSSGITQKSAQPYENYDKTFIINDYANLSSQFTKRTQQVPFSLEIRGTGKLRKP